MSAREGMVPIDKVCEQDVRNGFYVKLNPETGDTRTITFEDHYKAIAVFHLNTVVPDDVATQYDVARNLYVYAWYQYRFYNVAEHQALTVLEFAIRERIGKEAYENYLAERKEKGNRISPGLKALIEYCRDKNLISNSNFSAWVRKERAVAEEKLHIETINKMEHEGLEEIELPVLPEDFIPDEPTYNHIDSLVKNIPKMRNYYAHGSAMLHRNVLSIFEMVSEFINQIFIVDDES